MENSSVEKSVQDYYGKQLQSSNDLQTNACCTDTNLPAHIKSALSEVHDEVMERYYGCGLTVATHIEGLRILDLGSGSGRDCYLLSKLVGEAGSVVGIDMTDEQLDVAKKHLSWHTDKFGYKKPNVDFRKGNIQDLKTAELKDGEFDLIVSNCVVNLAENKRAVLSEAHRVLKEGGEFYFSDVYCNRRIPEEFKSDQELYGECLSGALYWNDFHNLAKEVGFKDPRIVESRPITIENPRIQEILHGYEFYSVTYRLFKLPELEPDCEDYGHAVVYKGGVGEQEKAFVLDDHHVFPKGKTIPVCGNTLLMLQKTRYANFFDYIGSFDQHFGIFEGCGLSVPYNQTRSESNTNSGESCC